MSDPQSWPQYSAVYFDGLSARRRDVDLRFTESLEIREDDVLTARWAYDDIRRANGGAAVVRISCRSAPELSRIDIRDDALRQALLTHCRRLDDQGAATSDNVGKIVGWSLAAAISLALIAIYGIPLVASQLTALIPLSLESRLGDAVANQVNAVFSKTACTQPDGVVAFNKLFAELTTQAKLLRPVTVSVRESSVANAFAIPGDRVYVLGALIDKADSPDELAGVLAHELGHVAHRDGLREMIASGGSAFFFGLLLGDVSGSGAILLASRTLLNASHSRSAERDADAFSAEVMRGLGRSPAPMGEFLLRLTGEEAAGPIALLASHPLSQDRLAQLKRLDQPVTGAPLLSDDEWKALKGICRSP